MSGLLRIKRAGLSSIAAFVAIVVIAGCSFNDDWRTASRESAGIAPDPLKTPEAVIQVYGADAWGWRGWFAIHTWISVKRYGEEAYTVYDVVGWRARQGQSVVRSAVDIPDRYWYGAKPRLLKEVRGEGADRLIDSIDRAVRSYPWNMEYEAFPGPNSNTFIAWIGTQVPELDLDLPFSAIGSGYVRKAADQR